MYKQAFEFIYRPIRSLDEYALSFISMHLFKNRHLYKQALELIIRTCMNMHFHS